ncbi:hypothetical protein [Salinicola aestuarinus]|uniref:hypothetical protein n=1 Tax=Salinicola aestuarinus TaxID=1949082 RepID=UPI000DA267E4|nr:hypothetical protein [Salinicola aestuarinus]
MANAAERAAATPANESVAAPERLARRLDESGARQRLARFGAARFEPAWLSLWAVAIGRSGETAQPAPAAWLLASSLTPRALLWPEALAFDEAACGDENWLCGGDCPTAASFETLWLWERLARPRRWGLRVQPATCRPVALPLWLGYHDGRHTRLIVLSGVSGEPLASLKPAVLAGFSR